MKMTFNNLKEFTEKLDGLKEKVPRKLDMFMKLQAEQTLGDVKKNTPVDTGSLRGGWQRQNGDKKFKQIIYNDVEYALMRGM